MSEDNRCKEMETTNYMLAISAKDLNRFRDIECDINGNMVAKKDNCNDFVKKEMVNHPSHYQKEGRKECIDEMVDIFGWEAVCSWAIITAYKYQYRCGEKDSVDQEKGKIKWYEKWALNNVSTWMNGAKEIIIKYFKAVNK